MIDNGGVLGGDGRDAFGARRQNSLPAPKGSPQRVDTGRSAGRGKSIVAGRALMDVLTNTSLEAAPKTEIAIVLPYQGYLT